MHTPGPWHIVHYGWDKPKGCDFVGEIQGPYGEMVYSGAASFNAISNLANARLIAAAPELLEALILADAALRHHPGGDNRSDRDIELARTAIEKAIKATPAE